MYYDIQELLNSSFLSHIMLAVKVTTEVLQDVFIHLKQGHEHVTYVHM